MTLIVHVASVVLWSDETVCMSWEKVWENLVITLPIKKSINLELFIDRMAALYREETLIRVTTNMSMILLALSEERNVPTFGKNAILD